MEAHPMSPCQRKLDSITVSDWVGALGPTHHCGFSFTQELSQVTTMFPIEVRCACCGHQSQHLVMGSTNQMGSPDLDLRPPEMERSTMDCWLQECEACHYTAPDLKDAPPAQAKDIVASAVYGAVLNDAQYPGLARRFLAYALLMDHSADHAAGLARLHAAWVCDDADLAQLAVRCRSDAAQTLLRTKPFEDSGDAVTRGTVVVDVLRRARLFDQAEKERVDLLALASASGIVRDVLEFEGELIRQQDDVRYTVADLPER
jgi:hypothetical protein